MDRGDYQPPEKRRRRRCLMFNAVAVLLLIIVVAVVLALSLNQKTDTFKEIFIARCEDVKG